MRPGGGIPLLYMLHSGNLYGTERMALATIEALGDGFQPVIMAPPGPVHLEARRLGIPSRVINSMREFVGDVFPFFRTNRRLVLFSTRVMHSLVCCGLNAIFRRKVAHIHMVHGGADEALSYGSKRRLNRLPIMMVAVSEFVRQRLLFHGVNSSGIRVIENFLTDERVRTALRREPFIPAPIGQAIVVSRLDPIKRIDLLFDALEAYPDLRSMRIRIFGRGDDEAVLHERAASSGLNVTFEGFSDSVDRALAESDFLIHLCPEEPFGLAILEAMAARIPVLVPDAGGAGSLVDDGRTGLRFHAGEVASLAGSLRTLQTSGPDLLNRLTGNALHELDTRFSQRLRGEEYRSLIEERLQ